MNLWSLACSLVKCKFNTKFSMVQSAVGLTAVSQDFELELQPSQITLFMK